VLDAPPLVGEVSLDRIVRLPWNRDPPPLVDFTGAIRVDPAARDVTPGRRPLRVAAEGLGAIRVENLTPYTADALQP
jgi:hypothetical protein